MPAVNLAAAVEILAPVTFEGPLAPQELLDTTRCKTCKPDKDDACQRCKCVKLGMTCTELCSCKGVDCRNAADTAMPAASAAEAEAAELEVEDPVASVYAMSPGDLDDMEDAEISQCLRDIGLDPNGRRRAITKRLREALAFFAAVDSGANRRGIGEPEGDWLARVLDADYVADLQRHVGEQAGADLADDVARAQLVKQWSSSNAANLEAACDRAGLHHHTVLEKLCKLAEEAEG